jgi:hypothetical protein
MILHEIDGHQLGVIRTETFTEFMVDHIFFAFFDRGRHGLTGAVTDLIDSLIRMFEQRGELTVGQIKPEQYKELTREAQKLIINGLIEEGTTGIHNAVFQMYTVIGQLPKK